MLQLNRSRVQFDLNQRNFRLKLLKDVNCDTSSYFPFINFIKPDTIRQPPVKVYTEVHFTTPRMVDLVTPTPRSCLLLHHRSPTIKITSAGKQKQQSMFTFADRKLAIWKNRPGIKKTGVHCWIYSPSRFCFSRCIYAKLERFVKMLKAKMTIRSIQSRKSCGNEKGVDRCKS